MNCCANFKQKFTFRNDQLTILHMPEYIICIHAYSTLEKNMLLIYIQVVLPVAKVKQYTLVTKSKPLSFPTIQTIFLY